MAKILIKGLDGQGPGDIVGAVAGETDINPAHLGKININQSVAVVDVENSHAEQLARQLDGKKVGTSEVSVQSFSDRIGEKIAAIDAYVDAYSELVELEREQEMQQHEQSIRKLSARQRQAEGKALLNLRSRDEGEALEGQLIKFMRREKGTPLPENEISVGDLVMLSKNDPLRDDNPTGTVVEKTNYSITAAFDHPSAFIFDDGLRMDLYVNDITYQRMKDALEKLRDAEGRMAVLRDIIIGYHMPQQPQKVEIEKWFNSKLNDSQKKAVAYSLGAKDVHLIHGPPGTGKTTTAIEVIEQSVDRGNQVLAAGGSNIAVDNMLDFLLQRGIKSVRVGHPARVTPRLKEHTLDHLVEQEEKYCESQELREQAFEAKDEQAQLTTPSGRYRRGMSDEKIRELAKKGKGSRGVSPEKIEEMAKWLDLQEDIDALFEKADALRDDAVGQILDETQVICSTNSTAGSELLENRTFDLVVIDEATQATEPSCLIPITHGDKVVMAGDHRQLPPTVKNEETARKGLADTLFERLAENHPEIKQMLEVQYRMHEKVMDFPGQAFYDGVLRADPSVQNHTLKDLNIDISSFDDFSAPILDPDEPVVFVDTSGLEAPERVRKESTSKENPAEAELVMQLAENLLRSGLSPADLAVISPYDDQVDLLNRMIDEEDLEIKTVDGYQGREKEAVVLSLTRSNPDQTIGFLKDHRRLNVALTRAKRKLVVIGDRSTVTAGEIYKDFVEYAKEKGKIIEA